MSTTRPGAADADATRVTELLERHRYAEALALVQGQLGETPDEAELHLLRSRALVGLGDRPSALLSVERALGSAPWWGEAHRFRALLLSDLGRHAEALRAALDAAGAAPEDWSSHAVLAQVASTRRHSRKLAVQAAWTAVRMAPCEPDAHVVLGWTLHSSHRRLEAKRAFAEALRLDPGHPQARIGRTLGRGGGSVERAIADSLRADPLDPGLHEQLDLRVWGVLSGLWFALCLTSPRLTGAVQADDRVAVAIQLAATAAVLAVVVARTPRRLWRPLGSHLRRHRAPLVLASLVGLGLANLLAVVLVPVGGHVPHAVVWGAVLLVGLPTFLLEQRRRRSAGLVA